MNRWIFSTKAALAILFCGWCGGVDFSNRNADLGFLMFVSMACFVVVATCPLWSKK